MPQLLSSGISLVRLFSSFLGAIGQWHRTLGVVGGEELRAENRKLEVNHFNCKMGELECLLASWKASCSLQTGLGERVPGNPGPPFPHMVQGHEWWDTAPSMACQEGAGAEHTAPLYSSLPPKQVGVKTFAIPKGLRTLKTLGMVRCSARPSAS